MSKKKSSLMHLGIWGVGKEKLWVREVQIFMDCLPIYMNPMTEASDENNCHIKRYNHKQ